MTDYTKLIADTLRPVAPGGKVLQAEMGPISSIAGMWAGRSETGIPVSGAKASPAGIEPRWLIIGRGLIGTREVPGPQHAAWIIEMWKRIGWGATYKTDEVAWCGGFIADCMMKAGLSIPKTAPRAKDWATWGVECQPQLGAVAVMSRDGGGHVTFLVGQSGAYYKGLGGNQSNAVTIADFPKARITHFRWPKEVPQMHIPLPSMARGTISRDEA